jgi:HupE / UreJ protein
MTRKLKIIIAALALAAPILAHRLDEYLQAIIVSLADDHIQASMRLIPGVAVSSAVIAAVDLNHDGVFSEVEQQAYAQKVLHDLSLSIDGQKLTPVLRSVTFPAPAEMKEGLGEIHIEFAADLPTGLSRRALIVENHHQPGMSVYLMNCLVPQDRNIRVIAQNRSANQSHYQVDYVQSRNQDSLLSFWRARTLAALAPFSGVPSMFKLGIRHIAEGTDHLLFLIALLLPAPLLSHRSHWAASNSIRRSLIQILRVVTAFTIGHSITLALGASGLVSLPEQPVEVLIAFSILISAIHAIRPLFPGREPLIAAGFGLIHGLAFSTTLQNLGVGAWQRVASVLGFNLGIETMQLIVVAAILPSLILLSRTPAYSFFRLIGALFAGFASLGWIVERAFGADYSVDLVVDRVAQRGAWIAAGLFLISIVSWLWREMRGKPRAVAERPCHPSLEGI